MWLDPSLIVSQCYTAKYSADYNHVYMHEMTNNSISEEHTSVRGKSMSTVTGHAPAATISNGPAFAPQTMPLGFVLAGPMNGRVCHKRRERWGYRKPSRGEQTGRRAVRGGRNEWSEGYRRSCGSREAATNATTIAYETLRRKRMITFCLKLLQCV